MTKIEGMWQETRQAIGDGRLSIVMPVYNLAGEIVGNLAHVAALFESHGVRVQLIPVDDGSSDGTWDAIGKFIYSNEAAWKYVIATPVHLAVNGGKGGALRAGFERAEGEYVMLLDGDLDINPKQTPRFFHALIEANADVAIGSKRHKRSVVQYPWHRRIVSWAYFTWVRLFIGLPITDTQTGMKLFRRRVLGDALDRMLVKTYAFDLELLSIAHSRGAKIVEAPVVIKFGSKFGALKPKTVKSMAMDTLAVFYRLKVLKYYDSVEVPPPMPRPPKVSVVVACPGDSEMLRECIAALEVQTYANWELIVLPDEPFDVGFDPLRITVVPTGKVRPAEKRNAGIKRSSGDIVAFIDDDAYPDAHWLEYAVKYFGDFTVGAVGGPGVTPPGDGFREKAGGRVYANLLVSGNFRYRYVAGSVRKDVDDYPSCNLLVRKDILESIGGYRTDFWPGEDTLLCKDIVDSGKRIVYDPWVIVCHHRRALFGPHLRQLGRYAFHRGYFCKRYPSNSLRLGYFVPTAFVAYLCVCLVSTLIMCASWVLFAPLILYVALVLVTSFSRNPLEWAWTAAGVAATHIVYGFRFAEGLYADKAPCEFIGEDKAK
ncbi:MAG: glycosyltransferase [Kiritimatiellae bacterium]|nr:glycosyltransferase [Kiritimatiellia bacterium]